MSLKQDTGGVRNPQDIERKYNLGQFLSLKKAVELNNNIITKTNNVLNEFVEATVGDINNLQSQIDGNITSYYYSGAPTLSNYPANEWLEEKYNVHLGDLYYDKDTGYAYRFYLDNENEMYGWLKIEDSDVTKALALANAAKDTADNKRRVFTKPPEPPYDNGDLWINDGEVYICQISKEIGKLEENDFIIATKYTDDTLANKLKDDLTILKGTVLEIKKNTDSYILEFQKTIQEIQNDIESDKEIISKMQYNFNADDLTIAKSTDPVQTKINNKGLKVYTYNVLQQITNNLGVGARNMIVTNNAQLGYFKITKRTIMRKGKEEKVTSEFYLKDLIEELEDLDK